MQQSLKKQIMLVISNARMYQTVKSLSGKVDSKPPTDLNKDIKTGKPIADAKERATVWWGFLRNKFKATEREHERPPMPTLPQK